MHAAKWKSEVPMKEILIIEDDFQLVEITKDMLESYDYTVDVVQTCDQAYAILRKHSYHVILLDVNLPDGTGFDVCRELREASRVPIIFASARTSEADKIQGLDLGGDDYLEKPYSLKELLSRINALIRRTYGATESNPIYHIKDLHIDIDRRMVTKNNKELKLSLKEFDVLAYLCTHANQVISKEELLRGIWGAFSEIEIATVAVHIRWLREKLEENPAKPVLIETVWGIGYRFHAEGAGV